MAAPPSDGKRTVVQKLPELIEWFLSAKEIELKFTPNEKKIGKLAPEFNFEYWMDERRITERGLAMSISTELSRMNYDFSLGKIIAALTGISWKHYVTKQEYPEWMKASAMTEPTRPVGRPRIHPKKIPFDELETVNSRSEQEEE